MIDIRLVRADPDGVKAALARRDPSLVAAVDELIKLDLRAREQATAADALRAQIKKLSQEVGKARRAGESAEALEAESRSLGEQLKAMEEDTALRDLLLRIPNL